MSHHVGIGYDIHRLVKRRPLFLGGVRIPCAYGLAGHSDADVVLHAICDAILGAAGLGDIGEHFPNTDRQYKNISSLVLLKKSFDVIAHQGYSIGNVDTVIQAEKPYLKEYKFQMRVNIAKTLHVKESSVNIKATTNEGLGAIGQGLGIAAMAVVVLVKRRKAK